MKAYRVILIILAVAASVWCFWTGYQIWTMPVTDGGRHFSEVSRLGVIPLVIPVLVSLIALWSVFSLRIFMLLIATGLLLVFWLISNLSIGMAYTPALMLLMFACVINLIAIWINKKNVP